MPGLSFGINVTNKGAGAKTAPAKPQKLAFGGDDSEDEAAAPSTDGAHEISTFDEESPATSSAALSSQSTKPTSNKLPSAPSRPPRSKAPPGALGPDLASSLIQKKHTEQAIAIDETIYDYDTHYDAIHARDAAKKAAERADAASGKPKYMENLLAAAETRKRDQLRAKDKQLQREREAEGDEFADKEKFVTEAYKAQQEEVRKIEEEEKRKEEEEEEKKRKQGMAGFFRNVMDQQEQEHREAVEAAAKAAASGVKPLAVDAEEDTDKANMQRARELNEKGANILINDDGEIADKRQLLSAGLNISAQPKPSGLQNTSSSQSQHQQQQPSFRGNMDAKRAMRERQTKMMEAQLEAATKRAAEEEAEELQKREQAAKSSKSAGDISDAKARYLARKAAAASGK